MKVTKIQKLIEIAEANGFEVEISKGNEPVYQLKMGDGSWIDQAKSSYEYNSRCCNSVIRVLYTIPPTAEQIEQSVTEACKAMLFHEADSCGPEPSWGERGMAYSNAAEMIDSGAWKEYK